MKTRIKFLIAFAIIALGAIFPSMSYQEIVITSSVLCIPALFAFTWWLNERQMKKDEEARKKRLENNQISADCRKPRRDQRSFTKKRSIVAEEV